MFPVLISPLFYTGHSSAWATVWSVSEPTTFVCFLVGLFCFVLFFHLFPLQLLSNSNYFGALKPWTAPPDTEDFLHATGDVSVGLNKPYPVKLL